jgi:hypothetical protein
MLFMVLRDEQLIAELYLDLAGAITSSGLTITFNVELSNVGVLLKIPKENLKYQATKARHHLLPTFRYWRGELLPSGRHW